jgi:thiamine kinase-like enzyme
MRTAHAAGTAWLDRPDAALTHPPDRAVFGRGDCNLSNFLWDGTRMRHVDFEDSGRSDVAVDLAELVEHIATRATPESTWSGFVGSFGLSEHGRERHLAARRLFALCWLVLLLPGGPASARNPAGTLEAQAERVIALLA